MIEWEEMTERDETYLIQGNPKFTQYIRQLTGKLLCLSLAEYID